ncbi:hypothetical protein POM88_048767 [Heracleum sosnowskyi]|uniref:Ankyrin repeat protein n=1 Tax=Heracleum sosnowskyi TaxID=360622 RepID=A0AAD8GWZ0_9APIA|nr:hypothetical protein POM88_048767 [Heracleum sosnowskyi]
MFLSSSISLSEIYLIFLHHCYVEYTYTTNVSNSFAETAKDINVVEVLIDAAKSSSLQNASNYSFEVLFIRKDKDRTALELAVRRNHLDLVPLMCGELPPFLHSVRGSPERAARNINLKDLIYLAAELGYKEMVKVLNKNYETGNRHGHKDQIAIKAAVIAGDKGTIQCKMYLLLVILNF